MAHCPSCPLAVDRICPSETQPRLCIHAERETRQRDPRQHYWHDAIRRKAGVVTLPTSSGGPGRVASNIEQVKPIPIGRASVNPVVRDAVNACPDRGSVLPVSMQPEGCGCRGKEVSECRDGRGEIPGRVTLLDCLACQRDRLGIRAG